MAPPSWLLVCQCQAIRQLRAQKSNLLTAEWSSSPVFVCVPLLDCLAAAPFVEEAGSGSLTARQEFLAAAFAMGIIGGRRHNFASSSTQLGAGGTKEWVPTATTDFRWHGNFWDENKNLLLQITWLLFLCRRTSSTQ